MIPHLFSSQLALLAILWLFVLVPLTGPRRSATTTIAPATPSKPKRTRSHKPTACEGLTHKPHCAWCARATVEPKAPPLTRPDSMSPTHRRPREVDTSMHFCPHRDGDDRGWLGLGNRRANGHPSGGPWRQCQCPSCQGYFSEHHGTILPGTQAAVALIVRVLACLAEGLGMRATARVFEVAPNTVLHWLGEAAEHLRAFAASFLGDLHLEQLQLAEVYAVLHARKVGAISDEAAIQRLERSPSWGWTARDPQSQLLVVVKVGSRTLAMAQRVVYQGTEGLAPGGAPRIVKKPKRPFPSAFTDSPSPAQRLDFSLPIPHTPRQRQTTAEVAQTHGLEDIARVDHGIGGSRTAATQRVLGDRKSHPAQPDHRSCAVDG